MTKLLPVDADPAAIGKGDARKASDQGGLARAVGADQAVNFTARNVEIGFGQGELAREGFGQAADFHPACGGSRVCGSPVGGYFGRVAREHYLLGWSFMNWSTFSLLTTVPGIEMTLGVQESPAACASRMAWNTCLPSS